MRKRLFFICFAVISSGCYEKCADNNPLAPMFVVGSGPEIWIHPNLASADFRDMFTDEGSKLWPNSRSLITTFQFHQGNVMPKSWGCVICEQNTSDKLIEVGAFSKLSRQWGKKVSFEAGALKHGDHGCDKSVPKLANEAILAIQTIVEGGGQVDSISMDWPFGSGDTCGYTKDYTAKLVKEYIRLVNSVYPTVEIGLIEGYSYDTPDRLMRENLDALLDNSVKIPFLHIDFDRYAIQRSGPYPENSNGYNIREDFPKMRELTRGRGIKLGIIVWGEDGSSTEGFTADAILATRQALNALGNDIDRIVFESWSATNGPSLIPGNPHGLPRRFPLNLPENKPGTLTWLTLNEGKRFK